MINKSTNILSHQIMEHSKTLIYYIRFMNTMFKVYYLFQESMFIVYVFVGLYHLSDDLQCKVWRLAILYNIMTISIYIIYTIKTDPSRINDFSITGFTATVLPNKHCQGQMILFTFNYNISLWLPLQWWLYLTFWTARVVS